MKFINNKKAQSFSIIIIFILLLTFLSFELFSFVYEKNVIKTRISTMDNFLFSIEENLERQMYISGFRILFLAESQITSNGVYINVDDFFSEAFFYGTVNGEEYTILTGVEGGMPFEEFGVTYDDLINSINQKASKINVNITLENSIINISQDNPWFIKFSLVSDFVMEDKADLARWEKQQVISASIPIIGFEDPLYIVNTYARVPRKIEQTPYEGNYVAGFDVSNLVSHVDNGYYAENSFAPSFLKRLEGDVSADENGIESFVNIPELSSQGFSTSTKSHIDYIYFSSNNPTYYSVSGMPSWFRIDDQDNHLVKYNVGSLI